MSFKKQVSSVLTTAINASSVTPAASEKVLDGSRRGRHAVEITAVSKVYIGDANVTSSNGRPIAAGESVLIPVMEYVNKPFYIVGGNCILTEYF